jgi:hypothetical protein
MWRHGRDSGHLLVAEERGDPRAEHERQVGDAVDVGAGTGSPGLLRVAPPATPHPASLHCPLPDDEEWGTFCCSARFGGKAATVTAKMVAHVLCFLWLSASGYTWPTAARPEPDRARTFPGYTWPTAVQPEPNRAHTFSPSVQARSDNRMGRTMSAR